MSQVDVLDRLAGLVWVSVSDLDVSSPFREGGVCSEHVDRLVALGGPWPPIVVMRASGLVVDGVHRVAAARRLGLARLEAVPFDGGAEDAFVEFVRRNVSHGLLLTLPERKRAAVRVLRAHGGWSDRRLAELCGLSPKTVGRLRSEVPTRPITEEHPQLDVTVRVGRDNRVRPVHRGSVRGRVAEALRAQPTASLRVIAADVGVSPETVRLVRKNLAELQEPLQQAAVPLPSPKGQADAALASAADGEDFLDWFDKTAVTDADIARAVTVPLSRVYELADEARRRSDLWLRLARSLDARAAKVH